MKSNVSIRFFLFLLVLLAACHSEDKQGFYFTLLSPAQTGIDFNNEIRENDSVNLIVNEYTYMGGGVGIGDFNRDSLPDIFFTGSQASCRLYLNRGNLKFEDVTEKAGLQTQAWCTGVSVVDINQDGWLDLYVSVSGGVSATQRHNLLFINRGTGANQSLAFTEQAAAYGLADTGFSTQAVFLDYDQDSDLDMYLLNHQLGGSNPNDIRPMPADGTALSADKLYRNEGKKGKQPVFKDVSKEAGILLGGYGLGVVAGDLNHDQRSDIYVANDYISNDILWLNQQDSAAFRNSIASSLRHQSYSSMGTDVADINNDGLPDIATLDMQPETSERKKLMFSFLTYERYELERRAGFEPELMRNMLHINNGVREKDGQQQPFFSEIGPMAGVSETDWSWSVLLADFDNDGWKDVHITNGMGRDLIHADFIQYRGNTFDDPATDALGRQQKLQQQLAAMGSVPLRNYFFHNQGDLTFKNISETVGIEGPTISNGAAYADLDNDGDLDLVINNINQEAAIYENKLMDDTKKLPENHYLTVRLVGEVPNLQGIGTQLYVYTDGKQQMVEQYPVRGYLSSVGERLHIGLRKYRQIDSLVVVWPDSRLQCLQNVKANQVLTLRQKEAHEMYQPAPAPDSLLFTEVTHEQNIDFVHKEPFFNDYNFQRLLPQKYSQLGPFISTGDVNGDSLTDFFIGGAYRQSGQVWLQQGGGTFKGKALTENLKLEEDMESLLLDADGDQDLDLLITSGSSEFPVNSQYYRPRLYLNDGNAHFTLDTTAIPSNITTSAQCVAGADFDQDGDTDIFLGGRLVPTQYPRSPRSFLLRNDGGKFTDVTQEVCPALQEGGMITSAVWTDVDNDRVVDLVVAGEWMPIRFFRNEAGILREVTDMAYAAPLHGFWRSLLATDVDADGDMDIVAGNQGLNRTYPVSAEQPAIMYAKDFDRNGMVENIICHYMRTGKGEYQLRPMISRNQWAAQMPAIKRKFSTHEAYAQATMREILSEEDLQGALTFHCEETRSGYLENTGNGRFVFHPFPALAQIAPVNAIVCEHFDDDGYQDILIAGNEYQLAVGSGREDASYGLLLKGDGAGNFHPIPSVQSGLILDGDVKDVKLMKTGNDETLLLVAINNQPMQVWKVR